ncbi:fimbrial biogenesis chaperone [Enterobacter ludwigii]|jgi:P pilus assembly chaperone PapD|uniref:fimbrial biogenesis chaperone n=1 Tax=Enterobacter ludwigii TaxID=299767 RepID=UPI0013D1B874|nr:fimbria/pilus periplasmic chaperone [Enterobacter ludwigii]ELV2797977.1 fimbria/pilus periplasmic chaperone [Enterobacter ludwigii]
MKHTLTGILALSLSATAVSSSYAALTVDRSRLIYNEGDKSISVNVTNRNTQDPYLAQGWMEDESEKKLTEPLLVLPPVQRVEPDGKTMVRIQALPMVSKLPKDRESVFWFNLREIPPKSTKPNTLTLAMQTRLKVFYRPAALKVDAMADTIPGINTLTLSRAGDKFIVHNPTPYHVSFVEARSTLNGKGLEGFEPVMVSPKGEAPLPVKATVLGNTPVLMFVNDYGSQRLLSFSCSGSVCKAGKVEMVPTAAAKSGSSQEKDNTAPVASESETKNEKKTEGGADS